MLLTLRRVLLCLPILVLVGCSSSNPEPPKDVIPSSMSTNAALFDPTTGTVPLPNILATASAADPLTGTALSTGAITRLPNTPMTPPEALSYVNRREMGETHAVSGLNSPIYIRFTYPVDPATVTATNIKVFQLTPNALTGEPAGTEGAALGFADVSGMFTYRYTAGGTDLFLFPNFPLSPGSRYLYVVSNKVKDAATGGPIISSAYFEYLKSTTPLSGSTAALEPIRANAVVTGTTIVKLSGYAKVMDDLISTAAMATVTARAHVALLGRFITTGTGATSLNTKFPSDTGASIIPTETALRSFAAGVLPGKTWNNTMSVTTTFDGGGTNPSPNVYWAAALGAGNTAPSTVGTVILGTINSADLSMDPVVVAANASTLNLTGVTGAYNPAAGVVQAFRPNGLNLTGFYSTDRTVPFVYIAPTGTAPTGGWPLVIYGHGIGGQKEHALAVVQSLTAIGRAVIAIDNPMHGGLAVPTHTTGAVWFQDFVALGAPLALRSNIQQGAFNLNRLELTVRFGGFAGLGTAAPSAADIKYVGHSLGSIIGAYYLAGNTTMSATGFPYTQATLNSDMKGYLSVPAGRWGYIGQDTASSFESIITPGLAAVGVIKGSPTYHQFFLVTQAIGDNTDPATMTTPLAAGLPSRLSGRIAIQESTGETAIPNTYTRYLGNALGGRAILGGTAAPLIAPGFMQLAYTAGGTPAHAAGVPSQFMYTLTGTTVTAKVGNAAVSASAITPTEGYFQFDQAGIGHGSLIDPSNMTNLGLIQRQLRYFMGATGNSIVVDPTQGTALPIAPVPMQEIQWPAQFTIIGH